MLMIVDLVFESFKDTRFYTNSENVTLKMTSKYFAASLRSEKY